MTPIKNVLLVGAGGHNIGPQILLALIASPQNFTITLLTRPSSTTALPSGHTILRHDYADPLLPSILKNHDIHAVICAISGLATLSQIPLIDACAASGCVRRFIPTEFGANTLNPVARSLAPFYEGNIKVMEHLKAVTKEHPQLSWTGIATGLWLDYGLGTRYLEIDRDAKKAVVWDEGEVYTSYTTLPTAALAVARCLERPDVTANQYLYVAEVSCTQNQIVSALENIDGTKYAIEKRSSAEAAKRARELWAKAYADWEAKGGEKGTGMAAPFSGEALLLGFARIQYGGDCGSDWREGNANQVLGIETWEVEGMLRKILKA